MGYECVCVLVSLLILHNLHALPLFLLLPPLLLLLLTVDEEPPQLDQQQQQKQPQKVGKKKRPFTMQSNCLRCRKEKGSQRGESSSLAARFEATQVGCLAVFAQVEWQKVNGLLSCGFLGASPPSSPLAEASLCAIKTRHIRFAYSRREGMGEEREGRTLVLRLQLMKLLQVHLCRTQVGDPHTQQANIFTTFLRKFLQSLQGKVLELTAECMHKYLYVIIPIIVWLYYWNSLFDKATAGRLN